MLALALSVAVLIQRPSVTIDPSDEPLRAVLQRDVDSGVKQVEKFFGRPFPRPFTVEVLPSRAAFDKVFKDRWGVEHTDSWAVAAGVSDGLYLLSPRVWKTEATEHDPNDSGHIRRIIAHELTHVYHGQLNPSKDFDGMDDLAWLIEGLATYVSGQLDKEHNGEDIEALGKGQAPASLATAWSGRYRYAVSGSLVRFVDRKYGRRSLLRLLALTKQQDVLSELHTTEAQLLKDWASTVSERRMKQR